MGRKNTAEVFSSDLNEVNDRLKWLAKRARVLNKNWLGRRLETITCKLDGIILDVNLWDAPYHKKDREKSRMKK